MSYPLHTFSNQYAPNGDAAWRAALRRILEHGTRVAPRGQPTIELLHSQLIRIDMGRAVVTSPLRKLSYRFQCAEALWILAGDNRLEPLTKHVKRMAQFSDDGATLAGAYGPKIVSQLEYIVEQLMRDRDTRQAVLTIWERNPKPSKDIPCTVAMSFSIRDDRLHQHVFMRSSDAWLGVPYDMFSFSMVGVWVACEYNYRTGRAVADAEAAGETVIAWPPLSLGVLTISATSSHIYTRDLESIDLVLRTPEPEPVERIPDNLVRIGDWRSIELDLKRIEEGHDSGILWTPRPRKEDR